MKVARKNTYYVYNAENGEFLGCGSRCDIRKYFNVGLERIESCAKSREPLISTKNDIILNISKVEGIVENIPFTVRLTRTECNFVEVFKIFRCPRNEEEKEYMRTHFSIINLDKVRFELDTRSFNDGFPFRINFTGKGRLRSIGLASFYCKASNQHSDKYNARHPSTAPRKYYVYTLKDKEE